MGFLDKIFKGKSNRRPIRYNGKFWSLIDGYTPSFTSWGGELYEMEIIRSSVHAVANHVSKLDVKILGSAEPVLQTKLRHAPNEWQTWGQFLYRLSTILDMQNTAYIIPVFDEWGVISGIFPALPSQCALFKKEDAYWLKYTFISGKQASIALKDCAVMTKFQYKNDIFGESNRALNPTMDLINIQNQGIQEAVKNSASFRFMAQLKNFATAEDLKKQRENFNKENLQGEGGGMLLFPNIYTNIQQLNNTPYVVSAEEMDRIRTNVFDYFGVNEDILQNKAYGDAWNAFYEGRIKPFAIQFGDSLSGMLFSENERTRGSQVMATSNRLQYMSNTEKLNVSAQMADRGIMNRDEIREIWNLDPLPDGQGKAYTIRGEYYLLNDNGEAPKKGEKAPDAK